MDPLSITVASTSLIGLCYTLTAFLYTSIQGVKGIDASIQALCSEVNSLAQTLQAIQEIWTNNPLVAEAQTRDNTTLWINIKKTLEDCQVGLEKLDGLCKKSKGKSSAGNSFFRRSIKQVKFSLSAGEIASSRLHIQAYNGAISIALQTFNISVTLHGRKDQENLHAQTSLQLTNLKDQIRCLDRVIKSYTLGPTRMIPPAISRTIDHLEKVVQLAESFRATASTVVDGGSDYRSDVDSVNGVPLGRGQYDKISEWIPVEPIIEEEANSEAPEAMRHEQSELSSKISLRLDDSESEEDLELETRLTGKFATLAIEKYISKDYAGAEMLLRKTLHRYDRQRSKADFSRSILDIRFILAYSCLFQCKLGEAEMIFISLLPLLGNNFQRFFTAMHSLANIYLAKRNLDLAETYSRRAMKGRRRHLGEESDLYYLSVLLFVSICREKGELAEADVYISLISEETWTRLTNSIPSHSSSSESSKAILPRTLELEEHYVHTYFIATPMSKGINENKTHSDLAVADSMLRHIAIRESPPMVVGNDHNDVVNSTISQRDLSEEGHILQKLDLIDHLSASKDDAKIEQAVDEAVQLLKRCFPNENFRMDGKDFCIENFKQLIRQSEGKGMVARQHWRKRGHGALYLCALRNCTILARILLERGADLNERFHCEQGNAGHHLGFKALDFPLGLTTLELAAGAGSEAMVRLCIEKGAVYTAQADSCSALYHAAECGRVGVMELLLSLPGQNVDERNPFGTSLLEIAVRNGHANAVEHLLKKNAQKLPSALSIAAQWGHKDVIRVLTRQGYDINKVHSNGETLLYRAVASEQNDFAIQLLECGADPDARGGMPLTPLFLAVTNEDLELVRALLDHGANPMASGFRRMHTPLNDARDPIIADELMKYGATIRTRPNLSRGAV